MIKKEVPALTAEDSRNGLVPTKPERFAEELRRQLEAGASESVSHQEDLGSCVDIKIASSDDSPIPGTREERMTVHDVGNAFSYEEEKEKQEEEEAKRASVHGGLDMIGKKEEEKKDEGEVDDRVFIIKDKTTGKTYDMRSLDTAKMLAEATQKLHKLSGINPEEHWTAWWRAKKTHNYELLGAVEIGDCKMIKGLLDASVHKDLIADVNTKGLDDFTPLHVATSEGYPEVIDLLISAGSEVNAVSTSLKTPLHIACNRGNLCIIQKLVAAGANINMQEKDGNTPCHILAENGYVEALTWILQKSPDLSKKNAYNETAVEVARTVEIRKAFGACPEVGGLDSGDSYKRIVAENMVFHNNRADMVKALLFKGQTTGSQAVQPPSAAPANPPPAKTGPAPAEAPAPIRNEKKVRKRIKILEVTKKLVEDTKAGAKIKEEEKQRLSLPLEKRPQVTGTPSMGGKLEEKINPYDFVPIVLLGKGSFGEVYLVKHKTTGLQYAMKVLHKKRILTQNLLKYATAERNVLCYTKHPFIVSLEFAFQTADKLFLVLEYCPGGDLAHVLQKEKKFSEERARIYACEVLLGLEDLHRRDIIFRDLKPENVVLDPEGHALLTDFGLSKEGVKDNISEQSFCGSIAYLAPEMLRRSGHGKSVDWYLLGLLIYEMIVGVPPYYSPNREQLFKNIQTSPLKLPLNMSQECKSLLIGLMNRNPTKRLGSGKGDADEIKRHPWFRTVDWSIVENRGLSPPKPMIKPLNPTTTACTMDIYAESGRGQGNFAGWDYVSKPQPLPPAPNPFEAPKK